MQEEKFKELLEKYLNGNCNSSEIAWLENAYQHWQEQDRTNLSDDELEAAQLLIWKTVQQKTADDTLPKNITLAEENQNHKFIDLKWKYIAAVAMLICICAVSLFLYLNKEQEAVSNYILSQNTILPGSNRATLTLADGRVLDLSKDQTGIIIGDTDIRYTDGSSIPLSSLSAPGESTSVHSPQKELTLTTPIGGQYHIVLSDGTKVWLNAASTLKYPSRFQGAERKIELIGEAYFEVEKRKQLDTESKFIVLSGDQEVCVLGTNFNINAYTEEKRITTTLLEGKVQVRLKDGRTVEHGDKTRAKVTNQPETITLTPGEQSVLTNDSQKFSVHMIDPESAVDWKNGEFVFRESLETAMRRIARWYGIEVVYESSAPKDLMLGGWVSRENNLSEVLKVIESTGKVHFKIYESREGIKERRVIVSK